MKECVGILTLTNVSRQQWQDAIADYQERTGCDGDPLPLVVVLFVTDPMSEPDAAFTKIVPPDERE